MFFAGVAVAAKPNKANKPAAAPGGRIADRNPKNRSLSHRPIGVNLPAVSVSRGFRLVKEGKMTAPINEPRRPRLSVAMIVRDEQDVLAETIEGVRPIADEIVVLDTGSSDQTPAIAERLARIIHGDRL